MPRNRPQGRSGSSALAALAASCLLALAGCADSESLPATEAVDHYDAVAHDLQSALAADGITWDFAPRTRKVAEREDTCRYDPGNWAPSSGTIPSLRSTQDWEPWLAALGPVLEKHGFAETESPEQVEGTLRIRTTDRYGAELTLDMTGQLRIWDARVDASPCTVATLGL